MISVCTSTFNERPEILARTWASLKAQTHTDFVWTIYDDSTDQTAWNTIWGFCADERYKIELFRPHVPSGGNIGLSKRNCFGLAKGDILVELDSDDELAPTALEQIAGAFQDLEVGFVFSDWSEINEAGESCRYPEGWAFGYGSEYERDGIWVMSAPEINNITSRHIVSMPNHVRAWRSSVYHAIGGHSTEFPVADDYELCVRTILNTKWKHIAEPLYRQHIRSGSAQRTKNALIQQLVAQIADRYKDDLTALFADS
jgi:O-antigen biosynthesis protein